MAKVKLYLQFKDFIYNIQYVIYVMYKSTYYSHIYLSMTTATYKYSEIVKA